MEASDISTNKCNNPECSKAATLQWPTCIKLKLEPAYFCSQKCFKDFWPLHKLFHKKSKDKNKDDPNGPVNDGFKYVSLILFNHYRYTGPLRRFAVTPKREVPDEIEKPDYHKTGQPLSEIKVQTSKVIPVYSDEEIEGVKVACKIGRLALDAAHAAAKIGVTTDEIDKVVHDVIIENGAYPSPLNYYGFPKSYCSSINEVICHGIPDIRPLQEGDILNWDISVYKDGYHGDLNETFMIGECAESSKELVTAAYDSLMKAIEICKPGTMYRQIGKVISDHVEELGMSVVRTYCGHGIGKLFHCNPNVPHYKGNKANGFMKVGHIFTIEPMINAGKWKDLLWNDNWTAVTMDGQRSAQFEHTLLITEDGCEILTARTEDSPKLEIHL